MLVCEISKTSTAVLVAAVVFKICNGTDGLAVLIPTRLFVVSTFRTFVSTVRSPVIVALASVAVPDAPRSWFSVTFFVVPVAAIDVSETSTMTNGSFAGSVEVEIDVRAVILESGIGRER